MRPRHAAAALALAACAALAASPAGAGAPRGAPLRVTIAFTGDASGYLEPCG